MLEWPPLSQVLFRGFEYHPDGGLLSIIMAWSGAQFSAAVVGGKKKWGQQKNETSKTALFCRSARILKAVEFRCTTFVERKRFGRMWRKCENKFGYVENFALFDHLLLCFKTPDKNFRLFKKSSPLFPPLSCFVFCGKNLRISKKNKVTFWLITYKKLCNANTYINLI